MPTFSEWLPPLCDAMIPLLAILLLVAMRRDWRRALPPLLLSIGWVYLVQTLDRSFGLWESFDLDYSSHGAVALAIGTSLAFRGDRWPIITVPLCLIYGALMHHLGYHTVSDMVSTTIVVLPVSVAANVLIGRRETDRPTPAQD
jgi:hypothetical protein